MKGVTHMNELDQTPDTTPREEPKYLRIANVLRSEIADNIYQDGDTLPTEEQIRRRFAVSRQTVRQAMALLDDDGLVERRRGSGTFVRHGARRRSGVLTVGVITTYITDYIFPSIVRGIESQLSEAGCIMNLSATYNLVGRERMILERMDQQLVDGLIVEGTKTALPNPNIPFYRSLLERNIPVVFINGSYQQLGRRVEVIMDDYQGGRLGAETLLNKGHRVLFGVFKRDDVQGLERYRGFMDRVTEAGIALPDSHVIWYDTENKDDLFKAGEPAQFVSAVMANPGAVLCYNDSIAMQLCDMIRSRGGKVPRDVSVMGFDDCAYAPLFHPRLTTLSHPKEEFGKLAAAKLLGMLAGERAASSVLDWTLVERDSVAACTDQEEAS